MHAVMVMGICGFNALPHSRVKSQWIEYDGYSPINNHEKLNQLLVFGKHF